MNHQTTQPNFTGKGPASLSLILAAMLLSPFAQAEEIVGIAWPSGIYKINPLTGASENVSVPAVNGMNSLARHPDGSYYTFVPPGNLMLVDPEAGTVTTVATLDFGAVQPNVPALAFSPGGTLYAINRDSQEELYTINVSTGQGTLVGATGSAPLQGLAFSPGGGLYAWNIFSGLVAINPATGVATDVNPSEDATAQIQCLAFAPDGTLYGAQYGLFTINTTTGVPTPIATTGLPDIRGIEYASLPALRLSIGAVGDSVRLCWLSETNKNYQLQRRAGLQATNAWTDLGPLIPGTGARICVTNQMNAARRYYRLMSVSQ